MTLTPFLDRAELAVSFRKGRDFGRGECTDGWVLHIGFLVAFSLCGIENLVTLAKRALGMVHWVFAISLATVRVLSKEECSQRRSRRKGNISNHVKTAFSFVVLKRV